MSTRNFRIQLKHYSYTVVKKYKLKNSSIREFCKTLNFCKLFELIIFLLGNIHVIYCDKSKNNRRTEIPIDANS